MKRGALQGGARQLIRLLQISGESRLHSKAGLSRCYALYVEIEIGRDRRRSLTQPLYWWLYYFVRELQYSL